MSVRRVISQLAALASCLLATCVAAGAAVAAPVGDCQAAAGWPAAQAAQASDVVALVNAHRATLGLAPLAVSPTLTAAAEWKSRHMSAYGYFAHDDPAPPVARTAAERAHACGYPVQAMFAENIATGYANPTSVFQGWLASPGHRQNIERASFAAIGVGVARRANGALNWVQDFGSVADAGAFVPLPPPAPVPAPAPATADPPRGTVPPTSGAPLVVVRGCRLRERSRRAATCRLRLGAPATVRGRLLRRGRTVARGAVRVAAAGDVRLRLKGRRPLERRRFVLRLRLGDVRVRHKVRLR